MRREPRPVVTPAGPFTRAQALAVGHTDKSIRHRIRTGEWTTLRNGVYVAREEVLACGDDGARRHVLDVLAAIAGLELRDAVASHRSAGLLHGLDQLRDDSDGVTLTLTRSPEHVSRSGRRHVTLHRAGTPARHRCERHRAPVTSLARTVVDLARSVSFREGVVIADSAMRQTGLPRVELERVVRDCRSWPGIRAARSVVAFANPLAESALESLARVMCAEQGLPAPLLQVVVGDDEAFARVDFYWPEYATVGEADGLLKYATPGSLRLEKLRQERLENAGFEVVRFTWDDVVNHPERTAARIRAAFARSMRRRRG